jgi:2-hydroxychromene-2-carboxylate isomerase
MERNSAMTQRTIEASSRLELWFDFGSSYSYLSVMRIDELARRLDVKIVWKPFLLGPIFKSLGWDSSPFVLQKEKAAYIWRDMERQCEEYYVPWTRPTQFARRTLLPMRVALLGAAEPWIGDFSRRVMQINFVEDREVDAPEVVREVLDALGLPSQDLLSAAQADDNKLRLREQTEQARRRGIFGAPTFFAGPEMFWGNDRLEDALRFAASGRAQKSGVKFE